MPDNFLARMMSAVPRGYTGIAVYPERPDEAYGYERRPGLEKALGRELYEGR
jgi:hypothetical protein